MTDGHITVTATSILFSENIVKIPEIFLIEK